MSIRVTAGLSEEEHAVLARIAEHYGASVASVVRAGVRAVLEDESLAASLVETREQVAEQLRYRKKAKTPLKVDEGGHWLLLGVVDATVRQRRRREYRRVHGEPRTFTRLSSGCGVEECVNPDHAAVANTEATYSEMAELLREGRDVAEIAERFSVTHRHVERVLTDLGVLPGKSPVWSPGARDRAELLLREGMPMNWVAEEVGVTRKTLEGLRDRLGLPQDREWVKVQLACRKSKALAPLHELFNPKKSIAV